MLDFPPCEVDELSAKLIPQSEGGVLDRAGMVEVISSLARNGTPLAHDLRWGVYVVFQVSTDYAARCLGEYGLVTDSSGRFSAMYKPYHLIGLELGISVASAALRGEATGAPSGFCSDVIATAKRPLKTGEILDGEGGYCVWGQQMSANRSLEIGGLPLGLSNKVKLTRDLPEGSQLTWNDVDIDENDHAVLVRREMEAAFGRPNEVVGSAE